jgi:hypothetical protein
MRPNVQRQPLLETRTRRSALTVHNWFVDYYGALLRLAASLMFVAALVWLAYQFWRLLWGSEPIWHSSPIGAIDLKLRHEEVHRWFAGIPVYSELNDAILPPATYAMLWPLLGWLAITPARWLWAVTTVPALAWLVYLVAKESEADTTWERTVALLMPLSMYATGAAIGNGQLIVHILPILIAGLLLLQQHGPRWDIDLLASVLILLAFVKPSISVPFFWIVLFTAHSLRPAFLVALGYTALSLFAISFQEQDVATLIRHWLARSSAIAVTPGQGNVANLHVWFGSIGMEEWILPTSLIMLIALGFWVYRYRHVDLWLLLGVTAYFTRFWTYHRWYDDLLILLPMIALFRIAKVRSANPRVTVMAGSLLVMTMLAMLAPGGLFLFPPPWNMHYVTGQIILWILGMIFLLDRAWNE